MIIRDRDPLAVGVERGLVPGRKGVHTDMCKWTRIRVRMGHEEISKRELCRQEEISYKALQKMLTYPSPPGYRKSGSRRKPKIGPYIDRIRQILIEDLLLLHPQRRKEQSQPLSSHQPRTLPQFALEDEHLLAKGEDLTIPVIDCQATHEHGEGREQQEDDVPEHDSRTIVRPSEVKAKTPPLRASGT